MISDISKIFFIIDNYKKKLFFIIFCFLLLAIMDLVGIGIIFPYFNLLLQEKEFYLLLNHYSIDIYFQNFKYLDLILIFSFFIILIFLIKALLLLFINFILIKFDQEISIMIKEKLINSYLNTDYSKYIDFKSEKAITNVVSVSTYVSGAVVIPSLRILSDLIVIIFISIFLLLVDFSVFMTIFIFLSICVIFYYFFF